MAWFTRADREALDRATHVKARVEVSEKRIDNLVEWADQVNARFGEHGDRISELQRDVAELRRTKSDKRVRKTAPAAKKVPAKKAARRQAR